MLEHVAANQTRFMAPGLSSDARGIALGRFLAVLLPSLDRVVGLFRGLSERTSLDDVLGALKIYQVKSPLQSREFIVQLPVTGSHAADGLAAVAALMGGLSFTGSAKHFVRYRDSRSPLGYDVDSLHAGQGEFILYDVDFVQTYDREREVAFAQLALGLSPQPERQDALQASDQALLRVAPGLYRAVLGYLHRNGCPCDAAAAEAQSGPERRPERFYLLRAQLQPRMAQLFRGTPGIELHRLVTRQVAVEVGWRHPLALSSCGSIFDEHRFYLFSGTRDCLDVLNTEPAFVPAAALVRLGGDRPLVQHALAAGAADAVELPLRLVACSGPRPPVVASRVPRAQVGWLKQLVYLLPPPVLAQCTICVTAEDVFLHGGSGIEYIPLGELFHEVAPGILVPLGWELVPRVNPDVLLQLLGGAADRLHFFDRDGGALRLARADFTPLSRRALARVVVVQAPAAEALPAPAAPPPAIHNEPVGLFPLWGFRDARPGKE